MFSALMLSLSLAAVAQEPPETPAAATPAVEAAPEITTYQGRYVVASNKAKIQAELDQVVETAAEGFPFYAEAIARGKLRDAVTFCDHYDVVASPTSWSNVCDSLPLLEQAYGAPAISWSTGKGDPVKVTTFRQGDTVRIKLKSESGTRTNVFKFSGDAMILHVTLEGESLPEPVRWTVKYRKQ